MPKKDNVSKNDNVLEIIQGIAQAAANGFDGALDEKGKPIKIGLKRENGNPINDFRIADGFKVKIFSNILCITYHSEILIKDVYEKNFENNLKNTINDIVKFLRDEYKKITGKSLSLSDIKDKPMESNIQCSSRVRCWVVSKKWYKIGGINIDDSQLDFESSHESEKDLIKNWLQKTKIRF